ncbi:GNAT family N-acetyltransferase [Shewanella sp. AS16]|uniref:GNAT family N-acetyltransferase n=1 Tax=Shewanella sp. AS16 TaxID=2907625 RepID=UPI001F214040|nr:GNAT family N-acetyltransferase [Shewanella sp. AS16]MCE9687772.1 GNAT family N-acetyltransferase [Shewanella sp. AS16]
MITETERLILRQFTEDDVEAIFQLNSIPEVLTYIPGDAFSSREQAATLLREVIFANYQEFGYGRWAVEHKADNKVIGFCGPKYITEFEEVELGYRYLPAYWGQGIGHEAAEAALAEFHHHGIEEAIALILEGNTGSEGVARKVGMQWREKNSFMGHRVNIYHKFL